MHQGVCGRHGGTGTCVTREVSYGLVPTGMGTWAYKPKGEIAGDAVREVGVTRATQEPRQNKSLGTVSSERRRAVAQKAFVRGKGSRREMANWVCERASRRRVD